MFSIHSYFPPTKKENRQQRAQRTGNSVLGKKKRKGKKVGKDQTTWKRGSTGREAGQLHNCGWGGAPEAGDHHKNRKQRKLKKRRVDVLAALWAGGKP